MTWLIAKAYPDAIPEDLREIFLEDENVGILFFVYSIYDYFHCYNNNNYYFIRANGF